MRLPVATLCENLPLRVAITRIGEATPDEAQLAARPLDSSEAIYNFWNRTIVRRQDHEPDKEHLVVIVLNTDLRPKAYHVVSVGSLNESVAHPREVFRVAILVGGYGIALVHNHPSGNCEPSRADKRITKNMMEAAGFLQIPLIDHVIVGKETFYSFADNELI